MIGARRIRGAGLAVACAGAVAVVLVWGASQDRWDLAPDQRLSSLRSESRDELMERLVTTGIREHPVVGVGFFQKEGAADVARGILHNSFLLVLLEHGIIGLAALLGCLIYSFYAIRIACRRWPSGSPESALAWHSGFALSALLLDALTVPSLWTHHTVMGFDFPLRIGIIAGLVTRRPRTTGRRHAGAQLDGSVAWSAQRWAPRLARMPRARWDVPVTNAGPRVLVPGSPFGGRSRSNAHSV